MSREIKFRQWLKTYKKFEYWGFYTDPNTQAHWNGPCTELRIVEPSQQFTGIKDRNGKEIYEGDIVRHLINDGHSWAGLHVVTWRGGAFGLIGGTPEGFRIGSIFNHYPQNVEVVGNIHEHQHLLTEE